MSIVCYTIDDCYFGYDEDANAKPRGGPSLLSIVLKAIFKLLLVVVAAVFVIAIFALILWFFLNSKGRPSLLLIALAVISILAIFALIVWYFKRMKAAEEEWIWVRIDQKKMENNEEVTIESIKEIQRKDIQIIIKKPKIEVTEVVEVVVTTYSGEKYIDHFTEEEIAKIKRDYKSVIKTSEEDESARKDTMEIEFTSIEEKPFIRRIKINELNAATITELEQKYKRKATVRETKEERRRKIKQILKKLI